MIEVNISETLKNLLQQEDTDGDKKITIEDKGPKSFTISSSETSYAIKGTYHLSNFLQELVIAKNEGKTSVIISPDKIEELPANRISRMIRDYYWKGLTRTMDAKGIEHLISDTKNETLTAKKLPVYIPFEDSLADEYYKNLETTLAIEAIKLPKNITPEFVKSINTKPGILSLKLQKEGDEITGVPFVVPGGRFNEMYGWDSYFESIGLLLDGKVDLAKSMADNFQYQIEHYGKILNANRSYYLTRTQPPFYSSLVREVYEITQDKSWLERHLKTIIKEYETVWMVSNKRLTKNGLNRYLAEGIGIPPECEEGHFDAIIKPYADTLGISINEYISRYNSATITNKDLDLYFLHDRSVRESGHDTSYRIDGNCADLNLVELNAMLYKYEKDIAEIITLEFNGSYDNYSSSLWEHKAAKRKELVDSILWNDAAEMYLDFDHKNQTPFHFESITTFIPMWANMCSREQADKLVKNILPQFIEQGGLASCTEKSRGQISKERPQRQWDYPNGWAPHQMMVWRGLLNYGYTKEAEELIYRWLFMITRNAVDYNGTIPEKYDVVAATHKVFAEYGNVGTDFEYITQEGFGWMNASFQLGMHLLTQEKIDLLNQLKTPEEVFKTFS